MSRNARAVIAWFMLLVGGSVVVQDLPEAHAICVVVSKELQSENGQCGIML